jgi:FKBP-type peptidyl-prolyl cis-trans isomerase SlyD
MAHRLSENMVGAIAYTLTVDGEVIESISAEDAIEYLHGAENIVPGLENALSGKGVGDRLQVTVTPAEGYGDYDAEDIAEFPREEFEGDEIEIGMEIEFDFDDQDEVEVGVVTEVNDELVVVDFNHPLAGKTLNYDVQIVTVRPATEDELGMGMPESMFDLFDYDEDEEEEGHDHN